MSDDEKSNDPYLPPGTKVRHVTDAGHEYGIVVHCWVDDVMQCHDCYVAFFGIGMELPEGKPSEKPYVLRYFAGSLTVIE